MAGRRGGALRPWVRAMVFAARLLSAVGMLRDGLCHNACSVDAPHDAVIGNGIGQTRLSEQRNRRDHMPTRPG